MEGYIKLHRKILDWGWWDDPNTCRLFLFLLLKANWEPKTWHRRQILPGQLVTGRESLAHQTGLSEQSVRTALEHLKSTGEITIEATNRYSLVTLVNWALYQSGADESTGPSTSQGSGNQLATNQQPTSHQPQLKKERTRRREEGKKEEEQQDPPALQEAMDAFREMRAAAKKRLTPKAEQMLRTKLEELAPGDLNRQVAILNQSTMNGWLGVFPLRDDKAKPGTTEPRSQLQRFIDLANGGIHDA